MQTLPESSTQSSSQVSYCLEIALLLCCARTHVNSVTRKRIQLLCSQELNWEYILEIATQQGVRSLLYYNLSRICSELVPQGTLQRLQSHFLSRAQRNLFLTGELVKIVRLLEAENIPVIPFKGAVLAASAYGNLALREFADLDILVEEKHVSRATELLIQQGYESISQAELPRKPYLRFPQFLESVAHKRANEFIRKDGKVAIDFHWSMTNKLFAFSGNFRFFCPRIRRITLVSQSLPIFSPEDSVLFLCMHGAKDAWAKLKWICDVAEVIHKFPDLNWQVVINSSQTEGCKRMLYVGLYLAANLLEAKLPQFVLAQIQADETAIALAGQIQARLFERTPTDLEKYTFIFKVRERWSDKLHYFLGLTLTPTNEDWETLPLEAPWHILYYLLRPLRLTAKYIIRNFSGNHDISSSN